MAIVKPRVGLYLVVVSLLLAPSGEGNFIGGSRFTSPSTLLIAGTLSGWILSAVLYRERVIFSPILAIYAVVAAVMGLGALRHGAESAFNVAYVFTQGLLLFFLALQLFKTKEQVQLFLIALCAAFVIGNSGDLLITVQSILGGDRIGAIRHEYALFGTTGGSPTTSSNLRSMLLPLIIAGTLLAPSRKVRILFGLTLFTSVGWVALAATRQGFIGLIISPMLLFMMLPGNNRRELFILASIGMIIFVAMAVYFSSAWGFIIGQTQWDAENLWTGGRTQAWRSAWEAFLQNPLFGHSWGASHSYILMHARSMGMLFLVPFVAGTWTLWRHLSWLSKQALNQTGMTITLGLKAGLIVALVFNLSGRPFATFPLYYFLLLVGIAEVVYLSVRRGDTTFTVDQSQEDERSLIDSAADLKGHSQD